MMFGYEYSGLGSAYAYAQPPLTQSFDFDDNMSSGPFASGPTCDNKIPDLVYFEAEDKVISRVCLPAVHGVQTCNDPESHDYLLGGVKYWDMGDSVLHQDKETCDPNVVFPVQPG